MHKEGGSFEIKDGKRVKIDPARREQLQKGVAPVSDKTTSPKPAGGDDVKPSKSIEKGDYS